MEKRRKAITFVILTILLITAAFSISAWFSLPKKGVDTKPMEIELPPIIYIRNNEAEEMRALSLDGMTPGEKYQIVFCVTPREENVVKNFKLNLAYTTNLGETIDLSRAVFAGTEKPQNVESVQVGSYYYTYADDAAMPTPVISEGDGYDAGELETAGKVSEENKCQYKLYSGFSFDAEGGWDSSGAAKDLANQHQYKFFIIDITWPEDWVSTGINANETDLVYIIVKGE